MQSREFTWALSTDNARVRSEAGPGDNSSRDNLGERKTTDETLLSPLQTTKLGFSLAGTWQPVRVTQNGEGNEKGGSSGTQKSYPPGPNPVRVIWGYINSVKKESGERFLRAATTH